MNFQYINRVDDSKLILDTAFKQAKIKGEESWKKFKRANKVSRTRHAEEDRIKTAKGKIVNRLSKIAEQFPTLEDLPELYQKLIANNLDAIRYNQNLQALSWTISKIEKLFAESYSKIKKEEEDTSIIIQARNAFYARASSLLEKLSPKLNFLAEARLVLRKLPDIKPEIFTVAIAGYPNVGKSSLLKAMTKTNPKIADYAFTTKNLNVGYVEIDGKNIQVIDVPGTFDRDFQEMNPIEKNAFIILQDAAEKIIFIIDASEYCGYSIEEQLNLFQNIKRFNKPIIPVINKTDISKRQNIEKVENHIGNIEKISVTENKGIGQIINKL